MRQARLAMALRDVPPPPREVGLRDGARLHIAAIIGGSLAAAISALLLAALWLANDGVPLGRDLLMSLNRTVPEPGRVTGSDPVRFPFSRRPTRRIRFAYSTGGRTCAGVSYTSDPDAIARYAPGAMCPVLYDQECPERATLAGTRPSLYPWHLPAAILCAATGGMAVLAFALNAARAKTTVLREGAMTAGRVLSCSRSRMPGPWKISRVKVLYSFEDLSGHTVRGKFAAWLDGMTSLPAPGAQVVVLYDEARPSVNTLWLIRRKSAAGEP